MKKNKKTIQDNANSAKVIPPYPRWVKICCAIVYWLIAIVVVGVGLNRRSNDFLDLLGYLLYLATLLIGGYGIYRAFRYFPKRAFCILALFVMAEVLLLHINSRGFYPIVRNGISVLVLIFLGLIFGQGILALFWKKARKWGWPVYLMALIVVLVVTGRVYNGAKSYLIAHKYTYVLGDTYLRTDEDNPFENR